MYAGRAKEAMVPLQTAFRLDPIPPVYFFVYLGLVYYHTDMYEEAIAAYKKGLEISPDAVMVRFRLAATYSALAREKEAHAEIDEVRKLAPRLSLDYLSKTMPYKNPADLERVLNDLRRAGLPE
jgi:adenylate cyclase